MKEFIMLIGIMHNQPFNDNEKAQIIERHNVPQQDNDFDCGVFALMFAYYIGQEGRVPDTFEHYEMNSRSFREKIYQDLMASK
jgi:Ulp1 family protease